MLIKQIPLTFTRCSETTINDWGQIEEVANEVVEARGSLQPMSLGEKTKVMPESLRTNDAKIFYTKTELLPSRTDSNNVQLFADYVFINNHKYIVYDAGDWTTNTSNLAHYKVVLVRTEK